MGRLSARVAAIGLLAIAAPSLSFADDKLHVCSITINSSDEIQTFRKFLPESSFDFTELTDYANQSSEDGATSATSWFGRACESGVQCDVLVLSGHFANSYFGTYGTTFAGSSGHSLSLDELEQRSCDQTCTGILQRPLEAFLFGCKTLGKSLEDRPLAKEDEELLASHGVPPATSELVMKELRNRGGDPSNRDRMRFVFAGVPHVYGFGDLAPTGEHARPLLETYFHNKRDYAAYLRSLRKPSVASRAPNRPLARAFAKSTLEQCDGLDRSSPEYERDSRMCFLDSNATPVANRLEYLDRVFDEPAFFAYLPALGAFFRSHPPESLGTAERATLERIQQKPAAREAANELVHGLRSPLLREEVLRVSRAAGWIGEDEALQVERSIAVGLLEPPTYGEGRDIVCGMDPALVKRLDVRAEDVPDKAYTDEFAIQALGCLKPTDDRIHERLAQSLADPRDWIARIAAKALDDIKPTAPKISAR